MGNRQNVRNTTEGSKNVTFCVRNNYVNDPLGCKNVVRGHPFMTSTRRVEGVMLMWTGGGGPAPCGRPHRKLKLESTDVILSSSHAKKLASFFYQNFVFGQKKSGNFSAI